jgi:putative ubiquitin-RnfH superfamily antitoxin RatB of RatAB toxin-antitoxin module
VAERPIRVAVVYAERDRQTLIELEVPDGTTAAEAVTRAAIRQAHPGIPADAALGIHGRLVRPEQVLAAGDRVELYRPLPADPKETRRRLAREGRTMGGRGPRRPARTGPSGS